MDPGKKKVHILGCPKVENVLGTCEYTIKSGNFYIIELVKSKLWLVAICDRTISGTTGVRLEYYILDSYVDRDQNNVYSKVSAKTNTWKYTYIRGTQMGPIR